MMTQQQQKYDRKPRQKAVELSFALVNTKEITEGLDNPPELLYRWRREQQKYESNSFPGQGKTKMTDLERENAHLKKVLRDTKMKRSILKKEGKYLPSERRERSYKKARIQTTLKQINCIIER